VDDRNFLEGATWLRENAHALAALLDTMASPARRRSRCR
jgi:hypothetical protein